MACEVEAGGGGITRERGGTLTLALTLALTCEVEAGGGGRLACLPPVTGAVVDLVRVRATVRAGVRVRVRARARVRAGVRAKVRVG